MIKVKYVGPSRMGVWTGRVGTVLHASDVDLNDKSKVVSVRWDLAPNAECQVTHSSVSLPNLATL